MKSISIDIPVSSLVWLATCRPEDAASFLRLLLAMSQHPSAPTSAIDLAAIPPTVDWNALVNAGVIACDGKTVSVPGLRKLYEVRKSGRSRAQRARDVRVTCAESTAHVQRTPPTPLSPPHTPPLTPHPQNPEVGQTRARVRGVPASIRGAELLDPNAEAVVAACERVTGRSPLKGYEFVACANWAHGMRFAYPDDKAVQIHGEPSSLDAVIRAACEHATPQTVSSRGVTGILRWLETTVQSCIDGGVWPNERIAVTPPRAKIVADPKQRERDRALAEEVAKEMGRTG